SDLSSRLLERLEDAAHGGGFDTCSGIRNLDHDSPALEGGSQSDPAAEGGELDGVAQKIPEDLAQTGRISEHDCRVVVTLPREMETLARRLLAADLEHMVERLLKIDRLLLDREFPSGDACQVEQV